MCSNAVLIGHKQSRKAYSPRLDSIRDALESSLDKTLQGYGTTSAQNW